MDYSIQLWSVQDYLEKDFEGTFKALSEMGYTGVEFCGFYGKTAKEVKSVLDKYNLVATGSHNHIWELTDNYDETVAFHKEIGNKNFIIPIADLNEQQKIDDFVTKVQDLIPKLEKDGFTVSYHNHSIEFDMGKDGTVPYEQLLYRTNLKMEVDVFWAYVALKDPIALLKRLGDRVSFIHIKDGAPTGEGKPLGQGFAPLKDSYNYAIQHNIPLVVESEGFTPNGLGEAKICIDFLRQLEE